MKEIHSTKNNLIKEIKKLDKRKNREETKTYLIEGFHLIEEAINAGVTIKQVFLTEKVLFTAESLLSQLPVEDCYLVSEEVLKFISTVPTPQGIVGVVGMEEKAFPDKIQRPILLLDNVQDPGNVGTMIRTADAAGFEMVVLGEGCADIYNSKVLRSMQGSNYHVTTLQMKLEEVFPILEKQQVPIYGTELNVDAVHYQEISPSATYGLILGNEGQGVGKAFLQQTTKNIYIPILGQAESLNVAVAAGILMFHLTQN